MVPHPAALDLPHTLVEWVTMLIVTREGGRRCKLPPLELIDPVTSRNSSRILGRDFPPNYPLFSFQQTGRGQF